MSLMIPRNSERFLGDEVAYMRALDVDDAEIEIVKRRSWAAMIAHGGSGDLILKIAATVGHTLLQMGVQLETGTS